MSAPSRPKRRLALRTILRIGLTPVLTATAHLRTADSANSTPLALLPGSAELPKPRGRPKIRHLLEIPTATRTIALHSPVVSTAQRLSRVTKISPPSRRQRPHLLPKKSRHRLPINSATCPSPFRFLEKLATSNFRAMPGFLRSTFAEWPLALRLKFPTRLNRAKRFNFAFLERKVGKLGGLARIPACHLESQI